MSTPNNAEDTIDLRELFFSLIAQWKLIFFCVILSMVCALLYLRVTPNTYTVNALVQVEEKKGASAALLGDLSGVIDQKSPAQAEIEILRSRLILGQVIHGLNLDIVISSVENTLQERILHKPEYATKYGPQQVTFVDKGKAFSIQQFDIPNDYLNTPLILSIQDSTFSLQDAKTGETLTQGQLNQATTDVLSAWQVNIQSKEQINGQYHIRKLSLPAAVNRLYSVYSVAEKGKLSGIIQLNYQGQDKEHIVQVLNRILDVYNAQNIQRRSAETTQTLKVLEQQLPELKVQLDQAELAFNEFRSKYNTVDIKKESELYLSQSIALESKKLELEQKYAEFSAKYTDEHPVMKEIIAQTATIKQKIEELNQTLKSVPDVQRQYLQLSRDVEVNTQLYTSLLNSYQQLKVAKAGEIGTVRIIDTAVEPVAPIKPKKAIILALSLLVGGFIGVLLALVRNLMRHGIRSANEIETTLGLPVYATVPRSSVQENRLKVLKRRKQIPILAVNSSNDIAVESLRSIRTALHFTLQQSSNKIITITGPAPELGKSFIAVNLATLFAQDQKRTLIIDADLRRGYLNKYFGQANEIGLSQYLSGTSTLEQVLIHSDIEGLNLDFIPRGKVPANPSELLNSTRFDELLAFLSTKYDCIIIDTPPVLAVTDSIVIARHSTANLVVARYAKTAIQELEIVVNRFEQANLKINGFILNDILREAGYGYGGYGYGYGYGYSYKADKD